MHKRIAKKHMSRILCDYLLKAVSTVRVDLSKIQGLTERAVDLIDSSEYQEEIYKDGGDMIYTYQTTLDRMFEQMAVVSYLLDKMALTGAADDLNPALRKELDKALKGKL